MISIESEHFGTAGTSEYALSERRKSVRRIGLFFVIATALSVAATFLILTNQTAIEPTDQVIHWALGINSVLLLLLFVSIGGELAMIWTARRSGRAAARLHIRIVTLFSILAVVPAIVVAIINSITLDQRLDRWFSEQISRIIDNSETVANAYVQEHGRVLQANLITMAADIDRARQLYEFSPSQFDRVMLTLTALRQVPLAILLDGEGNVQTRSVVDPDVTPIMPPPAAFDKAASGDPVVLAHPGQVGGLMKLKAYDDLYLYVIRPIDEQVTEYVQMTQSGARLYRELEQSRPGVQVAYAMLYVGIAMMLLLAAIWGGLGFSDGLVTPIRRLITAADQVSRGNLHVHVPVKEREGDFANLGAMFNTMTQQLRSQRDEILAASEKENLRRKFTEAVLAGVTASVVGIDHSGHVTIANRSALDLFGVNEQALIGEKLTRVVPELEDFLAAVLMSDRPIPPTEVSIQRGRRNRILTVRATGSTADEQGASVVITLDDITDLVSAQRSAAWADVARRIAHEIKNPLTPIQLSAERIRRRYGKKVGDDTAVFDQCVDTIVRQVGDIGRMVDEFSAFARMPKPVMEARDLGAIVREAAFLQSVGFPAIEFSTDIPDEPLTGQFDERLIVQAVSNLVKNAAEAVGTYRYGPGETGHVKVSVAKAGKEYVIDICDNGPGFPSEARENLLEPYMTTREKGTGLGLAIVRKIIEEHNGRIELLDAPQVAEGGHGALVRITLSEAGVPQPAAAAAEP